MSRNSLDDLREQVLWVCDALIPNDPDDEFPSAVRADVPDNYLPRALSIRADLASEFLACLATLPREPPPEPLSNLRALGTSSFDLLSNLVAGAYFLNPEVKASLGYSGQEAMTGDVDYNEIAEAIERVESRGPRFVTP